MAKNIGEAWGSIRGIIRESLPFSDIKDLVGWAGLPVNQLAHLHQKPKGWASKGQLMDGIDELVNDLDENDRNRFVVACVEGLLERRTDIETLRTALGRVGWGITNEKAIYPLGLQIELETSLLDANLQGGIDKTLRRYRDGDFDGAMTAVCGLVDDITKKIYAEKSLGEYGSDSYHERVAKSFRALEDKYKAPLNEMPIEEITRIWNNHSKAINQTAYVLGAFRREYSDVHGVQNAPPVLVQRAIDCAVFIVRSIGSLA